MSKNIFCIGELLIDMVCVDNKGLKDGERFEKKAGGAPANVAACISKLDGNAYFLGQVGDDYFGKHLIELLKDLNINTEMTVEKGSTTIALVGIDANGERNFDFLRGSDGEYSFNNINLSKIADSDIIHFGSATGFLEGELKKTYFKLLEYAKSNNIYVSFDPNYRDALITPDKLEMFIEDSVEFIRKSDFTKLSDEELFLLTKERDVIAGVNKLHELGVKVVTITLGSEGTYLSVDGQREIIPSIEIKQVDSTGAGDAFVGAVLKQVSDIENKQNIRFEEWKDIILFANKVGAITCTNYGAIASMPILSEVRNLF
ncbi:carbohydrate kinase family protein [Clostridium beijerinckii]|jgi:fructokinase|uniref:Carbohydrate kinase n=2 Tax=Clostridium beijerinckii TaxID=1520 RepID=A0AAE2RTM5_CLOBE|nr:carbohydrate kinase [Clostridium beijerinckii]ABR35990.1 PfkB domain protein [Clostridium beijerinckii NCIMB 8052]AIU03070.1 ribokinase-like domain-containing protein [Clostridium beijerinckii ATCC 35702]MBF7809369.1 carbohydrate kinase [Clostridium beijerinckii]NRT22964.1 fructokinase [Clostridium beijerinckii]NRT69876.1 fructokinase [Clostridium beijerinckii]